MHIEINNPHTLDLAILKGLPPMKIEVLAMSRLVFLQ
jgi:hypothetical protein